MATILSLTALCAVFSPVRHNWSDAPRDDFPLSYYPMFSSKRDRTIPVAHLEGIEADGTPHIVPYHFVSPGDFNYMRKFIRREIAVGDAGALCEFAARSLAAAPNPELAEVSMVQVVTGAYLLASFYDGRLEAESKTIHARCGVVR